VQLAPCLAPDVVLVDLMLPDGDGVALIERLREWYRQRVSCSVCTIRSTTARERLARARAPSSQARATTSCWSAIRASARRAPRTTLIYRPPEAACDQSPDKLATRRRSL